MERTPYRIALAGFAVLVFSMGVGRFAFTPMLPIMQNEGLLSISGGGVLASVHFVGYAMGALLAARLTSSPSATLFVSLVLIGLSTIAMGLTGSLPIWLFSRWLAGVLSALVLVVVSNHFLRQLAKAGRPDLQGLVFAGVGGGTALVGLVTLGMMSVQAESWLGWQIFGLAALAATAVIYAMIGGSSFPAQHAETGKEARPTPLAWRLILPYGAMGAGYIIPATYLPVMAQQAVSSPLVFGWSWPIFGTAAALSTLVGARLHARYSNRRIWLVGQAIMAIGLLLPALWADIAAVVIGGICVGGTFMVITMAGMKEAHRIAGSASAQRHIAAMTAAFALGQIVGPLLAAWVYASTSSFAWPLLLASGLLLITLLPMLRRQLAEHT